MLGGGGGPWLLTGVFAELCQDWAAALAARLLAVGRQRGLILLRRTPTRRTVQRYRRWPDDRGDRVATVSSAGRTGDVLRHVQMPVGDCAELTLLRGDSKPNQFMPCNRRRQGCRCRSSLFWPRCARAGRCRNAFRACASGRSIDGVHPIGLIVPRRPPNGVLFG